MPDDKPPQDELNRDEFYADAEDGGDEYELEDPDQDVLAAEQRLAQEHVDAVASRIDVDEMLREEENVVHEKWLTEAFQNGWFRFQTKHLLIATALLAIFLTIGRLAPNGYILAAFLYFVGGIVCALVFLNRKEREHAAKLEKRKRSIRKSLGQSPTGPKGTAPATNDLDAALEKAIKQGSEFRFSFSLQQMMIAMTVAAVALGLIQLMGGMDTMATFLGLLAVIGLIIHTVGIEVPAFVTLGWWCVLALYVLVSITSIFVTSFA